MDLTAVIAGIAGGVLIWCSLKNKYPLDVIKAALSGGDPNAVTRPMGVMPVEQPTDTTPAPNPLDPATPVPAVPGLEGSPNRLGK